MNKTDLNEKILTNRDGDASYEYKDFTELYEEPKFKIFEAGKAFKVNYKQKNGEAIFITDSGKVCLGTNAPDAKLDITSTVCDFNEELDRVITKQKNKKNIMSNIKTTLKRISLTGDKKKFVEAEMMDIEGNWSDEIKDFAREQMLEEYMKTAEFTDQMKKIANDRLKD